MSASSDVPGSGRAFTAAAQRSRDVARPPLVLSRTELYLRGVTPSQLGANLAARRWQTVGRAVVLHAGPLTRRQQWMAALVNVGPRSMLAAFTAAERHGLNGWRRDEIDVVAPAGTKLRAAGGLPIRLHLTRAWTVPANVTGRLCQPIAPALILAAAQFQDPRPACGLLAAAVQQRLLAASRLLDAIEATGCVRHRAALLAAMYDIAGGSQALSEIDFVRLCRRHGLPAPIRQLVRRDSSGRRRYLDATWRRSDGRLVVAEVDGALHLSPRRWWDDQQRQNELALAGALVLRFPSVVVRTDPATVVRQLRRALDGH